MTSILEIVGPVFCLIGLGYLIARTGYLPSQAGDGLSEFVFKVAVPLLLMQSIGTATFSEGSGWATWLAFWGTYFTGVLVVWVAAMLLIAHAFRRGRRVSVIAGVAAGFSNLVLMGIPLIQRALGQEGLQAFLVLIAVHLPLMMAISTFLMEYAARADGTEDTPLEPGTIARSLGRNLLVNPIILGIFAGLLWRATGIGLAGIPKTVLDLLSGTTGPLALIALGMGLIKYGIRGNLAPALSLVFFSLVAMPAIVWAAGQWVLDLPVLWLQVAVLAAACPTGINAYLFATHFKAGEGLATNTIVLAAVGSVVTLPFWLALVV